MEYVIVKDPVAWIDIDWTTTEVGGPREAGVEIRRSIRAKVRFLPRSDLLDMLPVEIGGTGKVQIDIGELAHKVMLDWDGPVDEDKRPVAFSTEILSQVIEHERGFAAGFELSYLRASNGRGKAREGNSNGSLDAGQAGEPEPKPKRPRASKSS